MTETSQLQEEIASLEERAQYIFELSIYVPDHQEMLWRVEEKLRAEAERLKKVLAAEP